MISYTLNHAKIGDKVELPEYIAAKRILAGTNEGIVYIKAKPSVFGITPTPIHVIFPALGKSRPNVFEVVGASGDNISLTILVEEFDSHPDPRYFDIIGLDGDGMPIYADEDE